MLFETVIGDSEKDSSTGSTWNEEDGADIMRF